MVQGDLIMSENKGKYYHLLFLLLFILKKIIIIKYMIIIYKFYNSKV